MEDTSKTNNCNRVGKHLFRVNINAVDMKERASDLGSAGQVEVGLVKKKGKILQEKETAVQRPRIVLLVGVWGEGKGRSLKTSLAFLESGCLRQERSAEAGETRRVKP